MLRSNRLRNYPGILMLALLTGFVAAFSWYSWRQEKADAVAELATVMEIGNRAADIYFSQLEMSLKALTQELEGNGELANVTTKLRREQTWALIRRFRELHTELLNIEIVGANGEVLLSANDPPGTDLPSIASENSFRNFIAAPPYGIDIGRPYLKRTTDQWIAPVRFSVRNHAEELRYIVSGHLPVEFLADFWKGAPIVERAMFGLIRDDGYLLSRYPNATNLDYASLYGKPRTGPLINYIRDNNFPVRGSIEGEIGSGNSLFGFHRLSHYPLTLFAVIPLKKVLVAWWEKVQVPYFMAAVMLLGGMTVYLAANRRQRNYERSLHQTLQTSEQASRKLDVALNNMSHGICMFDSDRRLILCNSRYFEIYNLPPDLIRIGMTVHEVAGHLARSGVTNSNFEQGADEVLEKLDAGKIAKATRHLADGRAVHITNRPLPFGGWVATHEEITAQIRHESSLSEALAAAERASRNLDVAVNNMTHGLSMFDANERLVIINSRYLQMYGMSPGVVKPGCTLLELFQHRAEIGSLSGVPEEYRAELMAQLAEGKIINRVVKTKDGRELSIMNRPMSGGGFVAIHEDVTERRRAQRSLEEMQRFLNTIIENAPVPIAVKEPESRKYVLVNRAYEELMGEDGDAVIGRTVHEHLPQEQAHLIKQRDDEAIKSQQQHLKSEVWLDTPGNGRRAVTTTRLVVRDNDGQPQHLISVIEDNTDRKQSEAQIAHMAHHDALTGLPNRLLLQERLGEALSRMARGESFAVFYLDLDRFKGINDTLGHSIGDKLLQTIAERLRGCVREIDTVARLGGDEFAIIQSQLEQPSDAAVLARRIRAAITELCELDGHRILADVSIGISIAPDDTGDMDQLLKNADMALYRAKADGRGNYRFFEPEMDARAKARHALEMDLRNALANGELELHYQPLVNLERQEVVGCEALVRWNHPRRGIIQPTEFIPIAEETGLIIPIGDWALRTACTTAATWPDRIKVAVNMSPVQFKNQTLALIVTSALAASGLPARRLEIEITETILMQNSEATVATLHQLRDLGVQIALDDFGTGYSSLSYLRSFPFDKIKVDRLFINDLAWKEDAVAIVHAVIGLAHQLNMTTTAEGVETEDQLRIIRDLGCDEMQGYLFSRPVPAEELAPFFSTAARASVKTSAA
ncbi:MAG TPA: EAL domain-containing protein [Xanthobacteraceae bacterium]|nr:EAL domain-containing protein [Xanthobacteraceae bacterium]